MNSEQLWMELEKIDQCQQCVVTETPSWRRQCTEPTGVRIPEEGQGRPDQTETFHLQPYFFKVVFGFSEEELKVLRRTMLLPTYYYIRH